MVGNFNINYMAVLAAAVANMVIGFLWYGPIFGKTWVKLMGFTSQQAEEMKKKSMAMPMAVMFIASLVMAYSLAYFLAVLNITDIYAAVELVGALWLGFVATIIISPVLWEGKPWKLYFFNVAYYLLAFVVMVKVLIWWR